MKTITAIKVNQKNKDRASIFLDGEFAFAIYIEQVIKNHLKVNNELSEQQISNLQKLNEVDECFNKSLALISKNAKTKKQIQTYLKTKGYNETTINVAVEKLEKCGALDDELYAKRYIDFFKNTRGNIRIKNDLTVKGISRSIIDKLLQDFQTPTDAISNLCAKFLKNKVLDVKTKQKLIRYLMYRGFEYGEIISYLNKHYKEVEND